MDKSSPAYRKALFQRTILENPWLKHPPTMRQAEFLAWADVPEIFYGGQAGGGKSEALLTGALQFVDVPGYAAIIFRKTYTDLSLPGALMDRAAEWLNGTKAKWDSQTHTWRFPSGASLTFGYLDRDNDRYRYQSSEFQYAGFDELTQFPERDYTYLFSRLRRLKDSEVPLRMRSASNPGGIGHAWVKKRFMAADSVAQGRKFVKATLDDNPHLDREAYRRALMNLDAVTRRQLGEGDWSDFKGERFRPMEWPRFEDLRAEAWAVRISAERRKVYRREELIFLVAVDWATSAKKTADHTAMGCGALTPDNTLLLMDVVNERLDLEDCVPTLARFCRKWHPHMVGCEALAFQASLANECRRYREIPEVRRLMPGSAQGAKLKRALPAIIMGENGRIFLPEEEFEWQDPFAAQLSAFTGVEKDEEDDMVDMLAYLCLMAQDLRPQRRESEGEGACVLTEGRGQI